MEIKTLEDLEKGIQDLWFSLNVDTIRAALLEELRDEVRTELIDQFRDELECAINTASADDAPEVGNESEYGSDELKGLEAALRILESY